MSSSHLIIVARNDVTGSLRFPLEDLTLYGAGGEEDVLTRVCADYGPEWSLSLYAPRGAWRSGTKQTPAQAPGEATELKNTVIGLDLAKGDDHTALAFAYTLAPRSLVLEPTAHLRWNEDGDLEQLWVAPRGFQSESEWRQLPHKGQFDE